MDVGGKPTRSDNEGPKICRVSAQLYSKELYIGARLEAVCRMGIVGASAASEESSVVKRCIDVVAMNLSAAPGEEKWRSSRRGSIPR